MRVEVLPLLGQIGTKDGPITVQWPGIERLILNNREIAKIKTAPGAAISLFPHVTITEAERQAITNAVAAARGGVPPEAIHTPNQLYKIITETDDEDDTEFDSD